ncbi:MAG: nucleotidyl transferase AbiEii/AbiGii toxin family protein [Candidatus Micrarchaeia archaeon]
MATKMLISFDEKKDYNLPVTAVVQAYADLEKVFGNGNVVLIGGRAVNAQCGFETRKTNDVDFLVDGSLDSQNISRLNLLGWKSSNAHNGCDRGHFERLFSSGNNKDITIKIDINTVKGEGSLPGFADKGRIISDSDRITLVEGEFLGGTIRVASPPLLISLKLNAIKDLESDKSEKSVVEVAKHMEDIYWLIEKKYGSMSSLMSKDISVLSMALRDQMDEKELIERLMNAHALGRENAQNYAKKEEIHSIIINAVKEKSKADLLNEAKESDTDQWLADRIDAQLSMGSMARLIRRKDSAEKDYAKVYPKWLLDEFDKVYSIFINDLGGQDNKESISIFAKEVNHWSNIPKKELEKDLAEIIHISASR